MRPRRRPRPAARRRPRAAAKRNRRLARRAEHPAVHTRDLGPQHRPATAAHRPRRVRLVPPRAAALVVPQRLAAADLIAAIAGQYAELHGRWMHLRVTARPTPSGCGPRRTCTNAVGRCPTVPGCDVVRDYPWANSSSLMGRSRRRRRCTWASRCRSATCGPRGRTRRAAAGARSSRRRDADTGRAGQRGRAPRPGAQLGRPGGRPGHRRGDGLADAPVVLAGAAGAGAPAGRDGRRGGTGDLASFTDAADFHQDPYSPTSRCAADGERGLTRHVPFSRSGSCTGYRSGDRRPVGAARRPAAASVEWSPGSTCAGPKKCRTS